MSSPTKDAEISRPPRSAGLSKWTNPRRVLALTILLGSAGLFAGMKLGRSMKAAGSTGLGLESWEKVVLIAACVGAMLLVLLLHELGHLLGGRLVGFRAFLLIVGPMRLERTSNGWSLQLNTDWALFGGLAGSAATDSNDLARRTAIMVGAGPVVSLLLGLGAALALLGLDLYPLDRNTPFSQVLLHFGLMLVAGASTAIGIVTLVPLTTAGYLSDGARLLRLLRGGPVAQRDSAIQALIGASLSGKRPRDWDPHLLAAASALSDGSAFEFHAWQFMQMHAADSGRGTESLDQLRRLLQHADRLPRALTPGVHYDAARQFALAGDLADARAQYALAGGPVIGAPYLKLLADAALLAADGRHAEAAALVPTIRRQLDASIDSGGAQWLSDALKSLEGPEHQ